LLTVNLIELSVFLVELEAAVIFISFQITFDLLHILILDDILIQFQAQDILSLLQLLADSARCIIPK
jgi:hypothetical protein